MPTEIRFARIVLAGVLAAVASGTSFVLADRDWGGWAPAATSIAADAANGLPTGKRTYHPQFTVLSDAPPPAGATTAQWAGGRQPAPPQPV